MTIEEAWIIQVTWINSGPTYHGPFAYLEDAERYARDHFADDDACVQYDFAVLSPVRAVAS